MTGTDDGHTKVSTLNDVLDTIVNNPTIDVFEFHKLPTLTKVYSVTFVDTTRDRRYGSFLISSKSFKKLMQKFSHIVQFKEILP